MIHNHYAYKNILCVFVHVNCCLMHCLEFITQNRNIIFYIVLSKRKKEKLVSKTDWKSSIDV